MLKNFFKYKAFWLTLVLVYIFVVTSYYFTSVGIRNSTLFLQLRRYLPCAVAAAVAVTLWQGAGLRLSKLLPHAVAGVLWALVYPACYWATYHSTLTFIDKHYDQSFGAYFFAFAVCLRLLLLRWRDSRCLRWCFGVLHVAALGIPLLQLAYFASYGYPITEAASIALLQTNPQEAREYLLLNVGYTGMGAAVVLLVAMLVIFANANDLSQTGAGVLPLGKRQLACALVVCVAVAAYGSKMFPNTGVMQTMVFAKEYFDTANKFKIYHDKNVADLVVTPSKPAFGRPATIIMVIGESASAYYMSAYGDTANDNTPWLRTMKDNDGFIIFPHAYTSRCQTVPALERVLTEKNQYNDKEFNQSLTVLDIAKKAGYETYWFSNQGYISDADTPITLVAKTADHALWLSEDKARNGRYQYDGDLLSCLKQVDPAKNNFVVLHLMGSHEDCINRYPQDFAKFSKPGQFDMVLNYDDSLAYTDYVLQQVHKYAVSNLNLQAMLYFSDHGGDPYRKRNPDSAGFKALQVPLFVYVGDEYKQLYADSVVAFRANQNKFFTNDLMYELVCGLLQVQSNHFNEDECLLNKKYKYTRDDLTTELGMMRLSDDKQARKDM